MSSAEQTMNTLWEHQEAGHLTAATKLVRSLGYNPDAIDFAMDPNSYFFPNIRGDMIVRPYGTDPDLIPIVGLDEGQNYRTASPRLHSLQRVALQSAGYSDSAIHQADKRLMCTSGVITTVASRGSVASVQGQTTTMGPEQAIVIARPMLRFNNDLLDSETDKPCASVLFHEVAHIVQALADPLDTNRSDMRTELEAFAAQATLVDSFEIEYTPYLIAAGTIDAFRKKHLGEHGYEPNEAFMSSIRHDPVMARILSCS